jgi:hypothetical protein
MSIAVLFPLHLRNAIVPQDPTLSKDGTVRVEIDAKTVHASFSRLWILPPGASAWEQMKEVATGGAFPRSVTYDVKKGTFLGWRLSVASSVGNSQYRITLTVSQDDKVVKDGILVIDGTCDAGGQDIDIDSVQLR